MKPVYYGCYLLTGATGAIGREIAEALAAEKKPLILACRNMQKAEELRDYLRAKYGYNHIFTQKLDLADEDSVRKAADLDYTFRSFAAIINNAGIMNRTYRTDSKGRELTMAVNYYNTRLFNELILKDKDVERVVFTTSLTRFMGRRRGYSLEVNEKNFSQLGTYGLSKKAITDYAVELAKRYKDRVTKVNCADPGIVDTGMISMHRWFDPIADICFRPFIRSPRQGAKPTLRALRTNLTGRIFCRFRIRKRRIFRKSTPEDIA